MRACLYITTRLRFWLPRLQWCVHWVCHIRWQRDPCCVQWRTRPKIPPVACSRISVTACAWKYVLVEVHIDTAMTGLASLSLVFLVMTLFAIRPDLLTKWLLVASSLTESEWFLVHDASRTYIMFQLQEWVESQDVTVDITSATRVQEQFELCSTLWVKWNSRYNREDPRQAYQTGHSFWQAGFVSYNKQDVNVDNHFPWHTTYDRLGRRLLFYTLDNWVR